MTLPMRKLFIKFCPIFVIIFSLCNSLFSQECVVDKASLQGTYTGDCKKGKANGKGKAVGTDTYEGEFKSGLPDGQGTYTWKDGNVFTGKYTKGLREGKGVMTFKRQGQQDSIVEGFWKKDSYMGRYEKPYIVHTKTGSVTKVEIEYIKDNINRVRILVTNTTGGTTTSFDVAPKMTVNAVQIMKGNYQRLTTLETHLKATETSLIEVDYPFRAKINMGREEVELELLEPGSYIISISINQ